MTEAPTLDQLRQDIVFSDTLRDISLTFHSTWGIFSPREVDAGSRLLLKYLDIKPGDDCLDLGCGYGVLGITMAKLAPAGTTLMVDKDFVAVDYARKNIRINNLDNAEAMLSNGFNQVGDRRFDVIVSNIPAKVGKELLQILLYDALAHLKPGGSLYVVTVSGLRKFIRRHFEEIFGNYDKLKQGAHYTVAQAVKQAG
jgi:16S rRNA G1207 methylase RsmC